MSPAPTSRPAPPDSEPVPAAEPGAGDALRAEHDALARRLAVRRSVDEARRGLYELFFGLLSTALAVRLAFDRWGPVKEGVVRRIPRGPPLFFALAAAGSLVLLVLAVRALRRSRRLAREEDALFTRFRALRGALGLDP